MFDLWWKHKYNLDAQLTLMAFFDSPILYVALPWICAAETKKKTKNIFSDLLLLILVFNSQHAFSREKRRKIGISYILLTNIKGEKRIFTKSAGFVKIQKDFTRTHITKIWNCFKLLRVVSVFLDTTRQHLKGIFIIINNSFWDDRGLKVDFMNNRGGW